LSSTSLDFTTAGGAAQTSTLTATTTGTTTTGSYAFTITGSSSGVSSETTSVCVLVSSTSGNCTTAAATSGVFYILNQAINQIVALSATPTTVNTIGAKTLPVSADPTAEPAAIAVAPNGKFLYVSTINGIYLYSIATDGSLTPEYSGLPVAPAPDIAVSMQVDSTNSWLVFAISGSTQLYALAINPNNGDLAVANESPVAFSLPSTFATQMAISPGDSNSCNKCYVFVAMGSGGTELINFNPANANPFGASATIHPKNANGGDNALAVDPGNLLLYVGETSAVSGSQTGGLRAFTITSSGTTELSGSPYASQGTGPSSILPSADGNYVYVANKAVSNSSNDNIASFSVSSNSLTYISTIATTGPTGLISLAEDSTGTYLFAADYAGNPDLQAFSMSSGTLTSLFPANFGTSSTGTGGSIAIAALP